MNFLPETTRHSQSTQSMFRQRAGLIGVLVFGGLTVAMQTSCQPLAFHDPVHRRDPVPPEFAGFSDYKTFHEPPEREPAKPLSSEEDDGFDRVQVIEFDDEGELWQQPRWLDPNNPSLPVSQFERALGVVRAARARDVDLNLIVFIHGWKHDANRGRNGVSLLHVARARVAGNRVPAELANATCNRLTPFLA